jgi:hypothetical protein
MHLLYIGVTLAVITYCSFMGYYWLYLPRKIRHWFEESMGRLFILDLCLTLIGFYGFSSVSDSLTAVIGASVLGFLGTCTTIGIRGCQKIRSTIKHSSKE